MCCFKVMHCPSFAHPPQKSDVMNCDVMRRNQKRAKRVEMTEESFYASPLSAGREMNARCSQPSQAKTSSDKTGAMSRSDAAVNGCTLVDIKNKTRVPNDAGTMHCVGASLEVFLLDILSGHGGN